MKIDINDIEKKMLSEAISIKIAQVQRQANTESDEGIKALRNQSMQQYGNLLNKINTLELK